MSGSKVKEIHRKRNENLSPALRKRKEKNIERGLVCYECNHTWGTFYGPKAANCPSQKHRKIHNTLKALNIRRLRGGTLTQEEEKFIAQYTAWTVNDKRPRLKIAKSKREIKSLD